MEASRGFFPLYDFGMSKGRGGRDSPNNDLGSISVGFALLDQEDEAREDVFANAGRRKAGIVVDGAA